MELTRTEAAMCDAVMRGLPFDPQSVLTETDDDKRKAPGPRARTRIRASVLRSLISGLDTGETSSTRRAPALISVAGVTILGDLNLSFLRGQDHDCLPPILLQYCRFTGELNLEGTAMSMLSLRGSRLTLVKARGCRIAGELNIHDLASSTYARDADNPLFDFTLFKTPGKAKQEEGGPTVINGHALGRCQLEFINSTIEGDIVGRGARLCSPPATTQQYKDRKAPWALDLTSARVTGSLQLIDDFVAVGGVKLYDARFDGSIWLMGVGLRATTSELALEAEGVTVSGHVQIRAARSMQRTQSPFCSIGSFNFGFARIDGEFRVAGGAIYPAPRLANWLPEDEERSLGVILWGAEIGSLTIRTEGADGKDVPTTIFNGVNAHSTKVSAKVEIVGAQFPDDGPTPEMRLRTPIFTREQIPAAKAGNLVLTNASIGGDLDIHGSFERPLRVSGAIAASKLAVEGHVTLASVRVDNKGASSSYAAIDLDEVALGGALIMGHSHPAWGLHCRDRLTLKSARIGGNFSIRHGRFIRSRPVGEATLDATAMRVNGDVELCCEVKGGIALPRAHIDGELRLGGRGREDDAPRLRLLWDNQSTATEADYLFDLSEVEVRHSLEVNQVGVESVEALNARQRRGSITGMRRTALSFYPGWSLVEAHLQYPFFGRGRSRRPAIVSYLVRDESMTGEPELILLDGTSPPIHTLNRHPEHGRKDLPPGESPLTLDTIGQARDYLRFFCASVWGDEGPFSVVEQQAQLPEGATYQLPAAARRLGGRKLKNGDFEFKDVYILYSTHVFKAQMQLRADGMVLMTDDEPVGDLSELPHIEIDRPLRYPPVSEKPARDVLDHSGSSYETVQPDSAIYGAVVRRWEGADVFGLVPLRPIEVNLIGLAASSLDDEDGEAWWKDWPAQTPPGRGWWRRAASGIARGWLSLLWRPMSTLRDIRRDRIKPLLWLRLDGMHYDRIERVRPLDETTMRSVGGNTVRPGEGGTDVSDSFSGASRQGADKDVAVATVETPAERLGRNHPEVVLERRCRWLMLQYSHRTYQDHGKNNQLSANLNLNDFNPQPYEELAKALNSQGDFASANEILIYRSDMDNWLQHRSSRHQIAAWLRALLFWAFSKWFAYGLKPSKALQTFGIALLIGWAGVYWANTGSPPFMASILPGEPVLVVEAEPIAVALEDGDERHMGMLVLQSGGTTSMLGDPKEVYCGDEIVDFLYAIDLFIPLLDLRQESECRVSNSSVVWNTLKALYAALGWIFTSLTVLTVSGVLRRRPD